MKRFLITTLAEYQTRFWAPIGLALKELGHPAAFLSFDDRSTEMLVRDGLQVFSATHSTAPSDERAIDALFERFGVSQLNYWMAHERYAFNRRDSGAMRRNLAMALLSADQACTALQDGPPLTMIQELGGFLSVVGSYFAARSHGLDNWFIEPSFFRGRLFFLRNSFAALRLPPDVAGGDIPAEVSDYLDKTVAQGTIVVPLKDRHQYTTARKKIVNWRNARRLVEKVVDKHVHGKQQEFGHIGSHVSMHARMLLNSHRLRNRYTALEECGRYVYYPLHVPGDMALTLRTPHLLDQLALIDYLCRCVPPTHRVVVKEHPAMIGAVDALRLISLMERHDNLALVPPATNNYKVLGSADAVVSINSKSGAEAGLIGKPVVVLGDAFYRDAPFASVVDRLQDLPERLAAVLASRSERPSEASVLTYFTHVWRHTVPGELYVTDRDNVATFARSMVAATR